MRHQSPLLNIITVSVSFGFILLAITAPDIAAETAPWILIISVFIVGIPHGAIDHIMAAELYHLDQTLKGHLLFYASYLFIMILVGMLWVLFPIAGMVLFLAISIYHFGQADIEDFFTKNHSARIFYLNRGFLIIGLIIFSDTTITYPIIADAVHVNPELLFSTMPDPFTAITGIIFIYTIFSLAGIWKYRISNSLSYLSDSLLLIILLLITGPLLGFAIYFSLWHSIGHINEMKSYFSQKNKLLTTLGFYKKAMPFTLISVLGLLLLFIINSFLNLENQFLTLMFILISVLTLPHMFIVDKMYAQHVA